MNVAKWTGYVFALIFLPTVVAALRAPAFLARQAAPLTEASRIPAPEPKPHDDAKPTVAVVLAADVTEITDMVAPYEMFARTGRYNVYAVAPSTASTTLTGGLRVRPHYSFEDVDRLLDGAPPAIVVAPNVPNLQLAQNRPIVDWVRRTADAGATMLSWCAGAAILAEAGLLDGRPATSHWGDLARLERAYPRVDWRRGVRWTDDGNIVTSAGITSGIDATLRLIARLDGQDVAQRIARELRYPNFHFALRPEAEQYEPRLADAVLFLNAAFQPTRTQLGLALYEGVGELDVSTVYDAHAAAGVAEVRPVSSEPGLVQTAHGLWLEPELVSERDAAALSTLDRIIVPGVARAESAGVGQRIRATGAPTPEFLHAKQPERFSLEPVLEDLARSADLASATFARRRLEYRPSNLAIAGDAAPWRAVTLLSLLAVLGVLAFAYSTRLLAAQPLRLRFAPTHVLHDIARRVGRFRDSRGWARSLLSARHGTDST